jgi:hypothetical protein
VVVNLMLIGLAIALDPLPLTAFLVVLPSQRGTIKGASFVFGWLVSLAIVVTITVLATGNNPPTPARPGPARARNCLPGSGPGSTPTPTR